MTQGHSWAGIAVSLTVFAVAGLPVTALAQEESGTKTAHELRADYNKDIKGKTIAFCCPDCEKKFNKDPDAYVAKMK